MGIINIEDLQAGMVLAKDVTEARGQVLLTAGQTVQDNHLRIFKAWGVTEADVERVDQAELTSSAADSVDPELSREVHDQANSLFMFNNLDHPAISQLYNLYVRRAVNQQTEEGANGD
ncbi:MAG: hypothetical protein V3W14_09145 [Candidatus Neomarinimicrobiota bacterium]